jgi:primosomal protein N' (replication factor Y)
MSERRAVRVAVENSAYSFDKAFDYLLHDEMQNVSAGCRVIVPFGNGNKGRQGIVTQADVEPEKNNKLKYVSKVIDDKPIMNGEMLRLMVWMKERTFCTLFEAAKTILPAGMCRKTVTSYTAVPGADIESISDDEKQIYRFLMEASGYIDGEKILNKLGMISDFQILESMAKKGLLNRNYDSVRRTGDLTVKMVKLTEDGENILSSSEKLTKKQNEIINVLSDIGTASIKEVCYFTGYTPAVIQTLERKKLITIYENEVYRNPYENVDCAEETQEIILNDEQQDAYENLLKQYNDGNGGVSLLYGVTGSGKTQVYLKLIDAMLEMDKQIIVMVPEIALTPQTLNIFHKRYGKSIAVFHSALSSGQRTDEWKRVKRGEVKIVIGTRSAVFAPLENIGLIIIDEEQEHTYKSEQTPRYNAKDVAKFRCAENKALLVMASATPSIETYANAVSGRYTLNKLSERYSVSQLPDVEIIDMCTDTLSGSTYFSKKLLDLLENNLENGRQSILLINRRGYNTFAQCRSCGTRYYLSFMQYFYDLSSCKRKIDVSLLRLFRTVYKQMSGMRLK